MNKKEKMFSTFAANLSLYCNNCDEMFACPLCMKTFKRDFLDELDLAHIVPKALKGRSTTLTCRVCNNWIGTNIESHETRRADFEQAMKEGSGTPIKARLSLTQNEVESGDIGVELTGILKHPIPELHFNVVEKWSNPAHVERIFRTFEGSVKTNILDWTINLKGKINIDSKRAMITYLHIAYLCLFHQFGYEWVLEPNAKLIRDQIKRPDEELVPVHYITMNPYVERQHTLSVHLIYEPLEMLGFIVTIPNLKHIGSLIGVWMPMFEMDYKLPEMVPTKRVKVAAIPDLHAGLSDPSAFIRGRLIIRDM
jgi:hypothetical protein